MNDAAGSLLDHFLPDYQFHEIHERVVHAPPGATWAALHTTDFARPLLVKLLVTIRSTPTVLVHRRLPSSTKMTLRDLTEHGFAELGAREPQELVLGLVGEFWRPAANLRSFDAAEFTTISPTDVAKAAWNFSLRGGGDGTTRLRTETRIACSGAAARRFRTYWAIVRPFSGLIRRLMLREIAREAELTRR